MVNLVTAGSVGITPTGGIANAFFKGRRQKEALGDRKTERADLKTTRERATTKHDQAQIMQKAQIVFQTATALRGLPLDQRGAVLESVEDDLADFGIPPGSFAGEEMTDEVLDRVIAQAQSFRSKKVVAKTAGERERAALIKTVNDSTSSKLEVLTAKIALGVEPRAVGSAAQTIQKSGTGEVIGKSQGEVAEGTQLGALRADLALKPKIASAVGTAEGEAAEPVELKKATQAANVKRIAELSKATKTRTRARSKARQFLRAFQTGGAESGATRTGLGFIPGVFTDQAEFDEKLDSFAEVAAREKLKAVGEIRPTDADVEGMKRALFGIGRDEGTNIQLLEEFISGIDDQDDELDDLVAARKSGNLSTFTITRESVDSPTIAEGATATNPDTGEKIIFKSGQWQPL